MNKRVNIHARSIFVTCRTQSSRLPGKALLEVSEGVLVIEHVLRRAKLAGNSFPVVLCTTKEKSDDILVEIANREAFTQILENNVSTTYGVCKAFMKTRSSGRIINMSSIYGVVSPRPSLYFPDEKNVAYGVSKAAINQLTRHLAVHGAPRFTVNSIVLGGIERNHDLDFTHKYSQGVPMGRMGQIGDVLPLLETLLFEQSEYLTGTEITLEGGYTAL